MRRNDPEVLKLFGLTEAEAAHPREAAVSAGVRKLFDVCRFMRLPTDLGEDGMGRGTEIKNEKGKMKKEEPTPPAWQSMTGLFPGAERTMTPENREEALQELIGIVLKLLRFEMKEESAKPNLLHTAYWDPLAKICTQLGISRAELSRLAKEGSGLAAHELVDVVRVKSVKEKMKECVREFVKEIENEKGKIKKEGDGVTGRGAPSTAMGVWKMMREARRGPQFHRGQWALFFGFPNYARFYRACLVFYQLAPQQLEFMAIEEVLNESSTSEVQGPMSEGAGTEAVPEESVSSKLARVIWEQLKRRHVQFFAEVEERVGVAS